MVGVPDTIDRSGFDPDRHVIGDEARAQWRDLAIDVARVATGDTQVAQQRTTLLLMTAAVALAFAPIHARVVGSVALLLMARKS